MPNPALACSGCKYFEKLANTHGDDEGTCHAVPPIVIVSGNGVATTAWPEVVADDWCGAFVAIHP